MVLPRTTAHLVIVIGLLMSLIVLPVNAQETVPATAAASPEINSNPEDFIYTRSTLQDQIKDVRATYRGQLESYRTSERNFRVSQEQYRNLQTLISLETAVKATQQVMIDRTQVLITYLTLLRLKLIDATGVPLPLKEKTLQELELHITQLQTHLTNLQQPADRARVNLLADEFTVQAEVFDETAHQALTLITFGPFQTVYDKQRALQEVFKTESASASTPIKQAEKERAFQQTDRSLDQVKLQLDTVLVDIQKADQSFSQSKFTQIKRDLDPVYSNLNQIISFLNELLRI